MSEDRKRAEMEREHNRALQRLGVIGPRLEAWELSELEPSEPPPSDPVVLRDLAHVLERGGEPYGWIANRLRTIADRLQALDAELLLWPPSRPAR